MSRRVVYVPLEALPQRYTVMANESMAAVCDEMLSVEQHFEYGFISSGQFLDTTGTSRFKAAQLAALSDLFETDTVRSPFVLFFADIFHPAVPFSRYMIDLLGVDGKVAGFNYAGWADPNDFVRSCGSWCKPFDVSCNASCAVVFAGSRHHKDNIESMMRQAGESTNVTASGYVWSSAWVDAVRAEPVIRHEDKEDRIIWPHRWCAEKGTEDLLRFCQLNPSVRVVVTSGGVITQNNRHLEETERAGVSNIDFMPSITKREYYQALSRSKYYLSTGYQETFGYTVQEAIRHGCIIAAPHRACYPEMVGLDNLYTSVEAIADVFKKAKPLPPEMASRWDVVAHSCANRARSL